MNEWGKRLLTIAIEEGNVDVTQLLLESGADVHFLSENKWSPLTYAIPEADPRIIELLIEHGADVNHIPSNGFSPLFDAALHGRAEVARMLLDAGAEPDWVTAESVGAWTPLHQAIKGSHLQIVELLLTAGADPNKPLLSGMTPLLSAIQLGEKEMVKLLVNAGADANQSYKFFTPLTSAITGSDMETCLFLLDQGKADPNFSATEGQSPLNSALWSANRALFIPLVERGADLSFISSRGNTFLQDAIHREDKELFDFLITRPEININHLNKRNESALHICAITCQVQFAEKLLDLKIDTTIKNIDGMTALDIARRNQCVELMKILAKQRI